MNWRPKDWENPYRGFISEKECRVSEPYLFCAFELGADAMLEALKKGGCVMSPEQMKLIAPDRQYPYGWLVFIPDEVSE